MAVEIEFRDGTAAVPDHVAWMMRDVDTHSMTKAEAITASETKMLKDHLNRLQRKVINAHFRVNGR